jgi:uncharacterized protein YecE (DUF72 family)
MSQHSSKIHIGTSGWSYTHWKENFYPSKMPSYRWLNFYATVFSTVEVNTTFYHTPLSKTTEKWFKEVPKNFQFAIKASSYITHWKRLNNCSKSLDFFYKSIQKLQPKAGPILFQLPPFFQINQERLEAFISLLKVGYRYTFEFRHQTWFTKEIYKLLSKHKIALCITDLHGKLSPKEVTADFIYLRLHGPRKAYQGSYGPVRLKLWKKEIDNWLSSGKEIYCFFDNDEKGYAIDDAKFLLELFEKK